MGFGENNDMFSNSNLLTTRVPTYKDMFGNTQQDFDTNHFYNTEDRNPKQGDIPGGFSGGPFRGPPGDLPGGFPGGPSRGPPGDPSGGGLPSGGGPPGGGPPGGQDGGPPMGPFAGHPDGGRPQYHGGPILFSQNRINNLDDPKKTI